MSENPFIGNRIEFHILQSFPVSCLNRDDVGAPKSAIIGGAPRARVSSQCWKRAVRMALRDFGVQVAERTRLVAAAVAEACAAAGATPEQAAACGKLFAQSVTKSVTDDGQSDTLFYISRAEADKVSGCCREKGFDAKQIDAAALKKLVKDGVNTAQDGLDIALFGRMAASADELNLEAAASFAHAISTHKAASEVEFFTAVDDRETQGAAHMGSLEYNSATYYRYVSLDLGTLFANLHSPAAEDMEFAVAAFAKALFVAVPPARQATMSAACPWDFARVLVRKGQRLQVSFATPVAANGGKSLKEASRDALNAELDRFEKLSGSLFGKRADFAFGEDLSFSIDGLVDKLREQVGAISRGE